MPGDAHDKLIAYALRWIKNRSSLSHRCCPELRIAEGYVADGVSLGGMQTRHWEAWCKRWGRSPEGYTSGRTFDKSKWEKTGDTPWACVHITEAKASRSDFLSTFGPGEKHQNRLEPAGNLHWLVIEPGVCKLEEAPELWGVLERRGSGLSMKRLPRYCEQPESVFNAMSAAMLWKSSWTTRWALKLRDREQIQGW